MRAMAQCASMEPALNEPVIAQVAFDYAIGRARFNGAGPERAGDHAVYIGCSVLGRCFNGAGPERAGDLHVFKCASLLVALLQWSRP